MKRAPPSLVFKVCLGDKLVEVAGFQSSHALGVTTQMRGKSAEFVSVMLMPGVILSNGFATLEQAHGFNVAVMEDKKLRPGVSTLKEFYAHAGGAEKAKELVEKIKRKAMKEKTA